MASNRSVEVTTTTNADGSTTEKRVETVDFESPAGQGQMERRREVEVVHRYHPTGANAGGCTTDLLTEAIQSAKEAIGAGNTTNAIEGSK